MGTFREYSTCGICSRYSHNRPLWLKQLCCNKEKGKNRVCKLFDEEHIRHLLENEKEYTQLEIQAFHKQIQYNVLKLKQSIRDKNLLPPSNAVQFISLIRKIHHKLFIGTGIYCEGYFRTGPVYFDSGPNAMEGVESSLIITELEQCWDEFHKALNSEDLIYSISIFFPRFFRIHPFRDGNGRTARMFIDIILREYDKVLNLDSSSYDRRKYVKALRFAHRRFGRAGWSERQSVSLLYRFLKKYVKDIVPVSGLVEEEPVYNVLG